MKAVIQRRIALRDACVDYDLVVSKAARRSRLRVGPGGVEVIQPSALARKRRRRSCGATRAGCSLS